MSGRCRRDVARASAARALLRALGVLTALFIATTSRSARAADPDPWLGRDKALHFSVAAGIAGVGYGVTTALTADRWKAFALGGGAALAAGALKEGFDATGYGDPSWKDFAWDAIGAVAGLAIAWGVDVGVHDGNVPPLVVRVTLQPRVTAASFALRF